MPFDGGARWQIDIMAADKTAAGFASVERRMRGLETGMQRLAGTTGSAIGQSVAIVRSLQQMALAYGVVAAAHKAFEIGLKAGDLGEQAEQLGITTAELQAYRLMAAQAGVSVEQLDTILMKLARSIATAGEGNDEMIARFERLNIKLVDSQGRLRLVGDVMPELARGLLTVGSASERSGLMAEFLGKSGARATTMLEGWSRGNRALVDSAAGQKAIVGPDAIDAWDKLGDQLKVSTQRFETMIAAFGKPVAVVGLQMINLEFAKMQSAISVIESAWKTVSGLFSASTGDLVKRQETIQAMLENLKDSTDALDVAKVAGLRKELEALNRDLVNNKPAVVLPEITVTAPGVRNPTGKAAGAAGEKLELRLKELQTERAALERALQAFETRGTDTVDEVARRLDAQVTLDKKIFDVLKGVPPNSALAQQLIQEATAVSQLTQKLDARKRLLAAGEQTTAQYGDGTQAAARATKELNDQLAAGAITADTYAWALKAAQQGADDQGRAARGAKGGVDGFIAGVQQGMADLERQNTMFETGKRGVQMFSQAIADLATGAEVDFGKLAMSFANMLIQMEVSAAASNIFNLLSGKGATNQGIGGGIADWLGGIFGGGGGYVPATTAATGSIPDIGSLVGMLGFADGGRPPLGRPSLVGEQGPELFVPDRAGTIYNQEQLAGMGGGATVVLNMTNQIGSVVSRAEMEEQLRAVEERARKGALAGVLDAKSRGGAYRNTLRR